MRTVKILLLGLILLALVVLALANREVVTLNLLPEGMSGVMPVAVRLPLFVVVLLSVVAGMVLGYLFEWLREHKHRRRASQKSREAAALNREVDRLRRQTGPSDDDVLALLGDGSVLDRQRSGKTRDNALAIGR
jgi:uncharacterized integral membrane protein